LRKDAKPATDRATKNDRDLPEAALHQFPSVPFKFLSIETAASRESTPRLSVRPI
jgi:hypothetical protein